MPSGENIATSTVAEEVATQAEQEKQIADITKTLAIDVIPADELATGRTGLLRVSYEKEPKRGLLSRMTARSEAPASTPVRFAVGLGEDGIDPAVTVHYDPADGDQPELSGLPRVNATSARIDTGERTVDFGEIVAFPELETTALHTILSDLQADRVEPTFVFFPQPESHSR